MNLNLLCISRFHSSIHLIICNLLATQVQTFVKLIYLFPFIQAFLNIDRATNSNTFILTCILITSRVFLCRCMFVPGKNMVWHKYRITNHSPCVPLNCSWHPGGWRVVGYARRRSSPLGVTAVFAGTNRNGVLISVKMRRIEMTLCQKDVKLFSAFIGRKQAVRKLNTWVHFDDYQKVISMYRKLSLWTCDARWRSQHRPPSQERKPVSAQLLWLTIDPLIIYALSLHKTVLNTWLVGSNQHWSLFRNESKVLYGKNHFCVVTYCEACWQGHLIQWVM